MKNTMKKIGMLFAVMIMTALCAVLVSAEETTYTEGYFTYTVTDGEASIINIDDSFCNHLYKSDLIIPENLNGYPVTVICQNAFIGLYNLNDVVIPASVTNVNSICVAAMTNIIVDEDNIYYSSEGGVLFDKNKTSIIAYPALNERKTYEVPDGVTKLGDSAFWRNEHIETLVLPASVCELGFGFFTESWSLTNLVVKNNKCIFPDRKLESHPNAELTIHGYKNSTSQAYAEKHNYEFVALECEHASYEYKYVDADGCNNAYEYYECTTCGDIKDKKEIVASAKHAYETVITNPTCIKQGFTTYTCKCGDSYINNYVPVVDHKDDNGDYKCDYDCGYEFEPDVPEEPIELENPNKPQEKTIWEKIVDWFKNIIDKLFGWMKKK